jgi:hypothetical protein
MSLLQDAEKLLSNMTRTKTGNENLYVPDNKITIGAYVYPGWHTCSERDSKFEPGWSEWDLVLNAPPRFSGHNQPRFSLHKSRLDLPVNMVLISLCMGFSGREESVCLRPHWMKDF